MRHARLLLPILLALTAAACARQEPSYYVTDSMTGQRVATGQQAARQNARGRFGSSAPQGAASYAYAAPQPQKSTGRGLFNSDLFSTPSRAPTYAYEPQAPQTYSYRPPQPAQAIQQAPQPGVMQYHPPQPMPQAYAQQPYYPPQPQPTGYYAERYRWY